MSYAAGAHLVNGPVVTRIVRGRKVRQRLTAKEIAAERRKADAKARGLKRREYIASRALYEMPLPSAARHDPFGHRGVGHL